MPINNRFDHSFLGEGLSGSGSLFAILNLGFEVVDVELENVFIINGVGNGILVDGFSDGVKMPGRNNTTPPSGLTVPASMSIGRGVVDRLVVYPTALSDVDIQVVSTKIKDGP